MNDKKRKQKQYYIKQAKKAKFEKRKLHPGLRGFLCTTNNKERECVREAYNLLNEYANEMYGSEQEGKESSHAAEEVEVSLEAELAALKQEKTSNERRFQQVESGAKNCIFISTQLEQTAPLVERIASEIHRTGTQRTRYLLRLLPVQVTCKATEEDIRASAEQMIKEAFTELGVTYTTVFRSRNQAQMTQSDAQSAVNQLIDIVCPTARLDHKTPQLTVVMEVIRNVICLGVVRDYVRFRKYNLVELAKDCAAAAAAAAEGEAVTESLGTESVEGTGNATAVPAASSSDAMPPPPAESRDSAPLAVTQGGEAVPRPTAGSGDSVPHPTAGSGDSASHPTAGSGDSVPRPTSENGDSVRASTSEESDAVSRQEEGGSVSSPAAKEGGSVPPTATMAADKPCADACASAATP